MDKQIRNIIDILQQNGGSIKYGALFQQTSDKTDALSAILHTGKKRGVVRTKIHFFLQNFFV